MATLVHCDGSIPNIGFSYLDSRSRYSKVRYLHGIISYSYQILGALISIENSNRLLGIVIVEDTEPAWFPANELREVHGIVPHEPTQIERTLFCIQVDGTEGFCCPTYLPEEELQEEE